MKNLITYSLLLCSCLVVISCKPSSTVQPVNTTVEQSNQQECSHAGVSITANFSTGRMDECRVSGNNGFLITLKPENTPINSSPWYAFKIESKIPTDIQITMLVQGDKHRYPPKISNDGKIWKNQPFRLIGAQLVMDINATSKPVYISAQEIINNQFYVDWAKNLLTNNTITHTVLGNSTEGRPIYKIESNQKGSNEWLIILGRQHPPEITGALALFPFVETLLSDSELALDFRKKYNILVIPNINPDGVFKGNWRHNANGKDLNRDWLAFSQVETKQINDYLDVLVTQDQKITFAVDFHSTRHDVFYSMPVGYVVDKPFFVQHWLNALDDKMGDFDVNIKPGNKPGNGVSKQYFADKFGVHAVTYEMGDDTDREKIRRIAYNASIELMKTMLSDIDHNKK